MPRSKKGMRSSWVLAMTPFSSAAARAQPSGPTETHGTRPIDAHPRSCRRPIVCEPDRNVEEVPLLRHQARRQVNDHAVLAMTGAFAHV